MKNIQKQYTDLLEGKMSKANFMRNVRMQFPQYVSPVTSYDDSIKILKGKRILSEAKQPEGVYGHNPSAEVTKYPNFDTVNYSQLIKGMKYELSLMDEITDENLVLAKKKALEALTKDPMAYRELMIANQKAITEMDKDLKMKDVKEDNKVDKANGMKVVKKDAPAAANQSKKFTNKVEKVMQMTQTPKKAKGIAKVMDIPGKEKVIALKEEVSPIASQWKVGTKFKNLKNNQVTTIEKFDNLGNVIISTNAMPGKQWTWPADELSNMIKRGELELMEAANEKLQALKESILKEFDSYKNEIPENFSKGQRVMTKDKKKVGEVTDVEQDTATVKLDDGTLEHIQLNVLTARDVPAKEEKVEETVIKSDQWNTHNYPSQKEWDSMSEEERFNKMMDSAAAKYGEKQLRIRAKDDYDTLTKYNPRVKQAMAFPKSPLTAGENEPEKDFPIKGDIGASAEKFKKTLKEKMKKALEELLYKNTKTGQIQSFDQNHPEDKDIMKDPQFNQVFKKA
jgi:hypothetical protein